MPVSTATTHTLWQSVIQELKNLYPNDVYEMWFKDLSCAEASSGKIVLTAPTEFNAIWIENNFLDVITQKFRALADEPVTISVEVAASASSGVSENNEISKSAGGGGEAKASTNRTHGRSEKRSGKSGESTPARSLATRRSILNPRNTFSNFVVGSTNQLAHAASVAVANAPGRSYNPLFVFGDNGLGKTHLMHAVAHQMLANNPEAKIAYVSTEKFTNEFIHAIRESKLTQFRKYYRNVDVLLVDDIHFLSGKESTQEEFFHTFNDLFESGRQILLASDRPVKEIERLENRLVTRFEWGLVTDIQSPDFETRVAILRKKAAAMGISLSDEVMQFLAERVSRNIRQMEGALTRVASYDTLIDRKPDLDAVEGLLGDLLHEEAMNAVGIEQIQKKVAEYYKIGLTELLGRRRTAKIVFPRQVAMHISRHLTDEPLKVIGGAFGGRDHGTVIHACRQVENMMEQDASVKRGVDYLLKQLSKKPA
ncbi:MAG: chromosomal replication initiator protein DnaA [Opitutales bacterium]